MFFDLTIFLIWLQTRDRMVFGVFLIRQQCLNHSANLPLSVRIQRFIFFRSPSSDWRLLKNYNVCVYLIKRVLTTLCPIWRRLCWLTSPGWCFFSIQSDVIFTFLPIREIRRLGARNEAPNNPWAKCLGRFRCCESLWEQTLEYCLTRRCSAVGELWQ